MPETRADGKPTRQEARQRGQRTRHVAWGVAFLYVAGGLLVGSVGHASRGTWGAVAYFGPLGVYMLHHGVRRLRRALRLTRRMDRRPGLRAPTHA